MCTNIIWEYNCYCCCCYCFLRTLSLSCLPLPPYGWPEGRRGGDGTQQEQLQGHVRWMLTLTPMVSLMEWQWSEGRWTFKVGRCLGRYGNYTVRPSADGVGWMDHVRPKCIRFELFPKIYGISVKAEAEADVDVDAGSKKVCPKTCCCVGSPMLCVCVCLCAFRLAWRTVL